METQRTIDRRTGVIVVHPGGGQMRSFETALGLQQAGLLDLYIAGFYFKPERDRKSTRLNSSHIQKSRMPSSA